MARFSSLSALPLALVCGCGGAVDPADMRPSVVLISLDTLRADHMSLHGYERETTPYLEKLAEESLVFDQAYSVAPWTLISHVTMLTGLYPEQHGIVTDDLALSPEIPYLAQRLSDFGYQTVGLYRPGFVGPRFGQDRGFDVFLDHTSAVEAEVNLVRELAELDRDRPFFLFLHITDCHGDPVRDADDILYDAPPPFDTMFMADARERLKDCDYRVVAGAALRRAMKDGTAKRGRLSPEHLEATVAMYDGKIRYVDTVLEEWIEGWRRDGLMDNTLVVITSDHGEGLGQRGGSLTGHGQMWQEGLHIPLIVRFPDGYRGGERDGNVASLVDVVPTILDVTDLPPDGRLAGYSLRRELPPDRVVGAFRGTSYARVQLPWKVQGATRRKKLQVTGVYNLTDDPLELASIPKADEDFERITKMLDEAYQAELASRPAFEGADPIPAVAETEAMLEELEALGYGGGDED